MSMDVGIATVVCVSVPSDVGHTTTGSDAVTVALVEGVAVVDGDLAEVVEVVWEATVGREVGG
jgi:hypothetical protein